MKIGGKRYRFKPNKNIVYVLLILIIFIWIISGLVSCARYNFVIRGAKYEDKEVFMPEFKVRKCESPDGTPTADYFSIYPPDEEEKVIYLTFDDGPSQKVTPQILDILKKYYVKATFFVIGENAERNPELIKRIVDEGHSVAIHSYSHNYDNLYKSEEGFKNEIAKSREALENIIGERYTDVFRFPGGAFREERAEFKKILIDENLPYVNWNCVTGDSETQNPVPANLLARAKKTASNAKTNSLVMLMHDAGAKQASADALPGIIDYFKKEGYEFRALTRY